MENTDLAETNKDIIPIYDSVDLLPSQKNRYNILCVIFEYNATYCVLIFKIGVNQQSHLWDTVNKTLGKKRTNPSAVST